MIIGAAGDPGGSRALLPIFSNLEKRKISFQIFPHGFLDQEAPGRWPRIGPDEPEGVRRFETEAANKKVKAYVFGSSLKNKFSLKIASRAKAAGVPVIHVLDHWANYIERLRLEDGSLVMPDIYTVMDRSAYETAIQAGIPAAILRITGQPAFYRGPVWESRDGMNNENPVPAAGYRDGKHVLFISEPVAADQGSSTAISGYRGYTEEKVLELFCRSLQRYKSSYYVEILPHPREDEHNLRKLLNRYSGDLKGTLCRTNDGRQRLSHVSGAAGMASVLLYEAWLMGIPVLSMQPGLIIPSLDYLKDKEDCFTITRDEDLSAEFGGWLEAVDAFGGIKPRDDYLLHGRAAGKICEIILSLPIKKG